MVRVRACLWLMSLATLLAVSGSAGSWAAVPEDAGHVGYYRFPAIHGDTIVFSSEGDLWSVDAAGGLARRLTTHLAEETHPHISPDGRTLAFSASYEGPREVYVMPVDGGLPTRLTWEGRSAEVVGWTPDARVMYATEAYSTLPNWQLVVIDPKTRERERIPLSQAADGTFSADGSSLYFTRLRFQGSHTKRYQGGTAQTLWRFDGPGQEAVPLTADYPGTSKRPMLWHDRLYFVSDRDGTMNLWSMSLSGDDLRQHTHFDFWDVRSPSLHRGRIVYQLGASLHLYDIANDEDHEVPIRIASDFEQMREHWIDEPSKWITGAHLSPHADRVALVARGEVFVIPVHHGQGRQVRVTRRPDVRYRTARFIPDSDDLVTLSDESGEVELWRLPANGIGPREQLTNDSKVLRWDAVPSPDGTRIAHHNKDEELFVLNLQDGTNTLVERNEAFGLGRYAWSPDSRWLAYESSGDNEITRIWLYDTSTGQRTPLTSDRFSSHAPAWDPSGNFLYFLSDRHLTTLVSSPWGDDQPEPFIDRPTLVYEIALRPGLRSPFQPDDELADSTPEHQTDLEGAARSTVQIDLHGITERIRRVPVPPGEYSELATDGKRLYFSSRDLSPERRLHLMALPITHDEPKVQTILDGIRGFELSADRSHLLVRKDSELYVFAGTSSKPDLSKARVELSGWKFELDPREEWRQMFTEAWRLERDYFYDRDLHGVDWRAMARRYRPLVDRVRTRSELSDVIGQLVSELSALHIFVRGGDVRHGQESIEPAALGARMHWDAAAAGYRIDHIYRSDPDLPERRSPLARASVEIRDGDAIVQVDGVPLSRETDIRSLLRDKAGEQVRLRLVRSGAEPFDAIVVPISPARERDLRYDEWEYTRRLQVQRLGGGRLGYVHLRAMGRSNWEEWARNYYPVFRRQGLIIDVRHNRGGNIDSWILEKLLRKAWFFWAPRVGQPYWNMQYAFRGHLIVLVDERTASDGEAFAEGFRRLGLGPVLGTRTWGGEIWLTSSNFLVDRGIATAAEFGVYGPEGDWLIEGWGVEPDIVVDNPPHATFEGSDHQLEQAVHYLLDKIEQEPIPAPVIPPRPDKSFRNNRRRR